MGCETPRWDCSDAASAAATRRSGRSATAARRAFRSNAVTNLCQFSMQYTAVTTLPSIPTPTLSDKLWTCTSKPFCKTLCRSAPANVVVVVEAVGDGLCRAEAVLLQRVDSVSVHTSSFWADHVYFGEGFQ